MSDTFLMDLSIDYFVVEMSNTGKVQAEWKARLCLVVKVLSCLLQTLSGPVIEVESKVVIHNWNL